MLGAHLARSAFAVTGSPCRPRGQRHEVVGPALDRIEGDNSVGSSQPYGVAMLVGNRDLMPWPGVFQLQSLPCVTRDVGVPDGAVVRRARHVERSWHQQ